MTIFRKLECLLKSSNVEYVIMTDLAGSDVLRIASGNDYITIQPTNKGVEMFYEVPIDDWCYEIIDTRRFTSIRTAFSYLNNVTNGSLILMR